jgi:HSP20 family protein
MVEKSHTAGWLPNVYEPLRQMGEKIADWFAPKSEASASRDVYEITVELPGVKAEDVDLSVHDNSLTVRGEKRFQREESGRTYFFTEREYGSFQRTFRLPADANAAGIDANFEDGVLSILVPKKATEAPAEKKIKITQR